MDGTCGDYLDDSTKRHNLEQESKDSMEVLSMSSFVKIVNKRLRTNMSDQNGKLGVRNVFVS